VSAFVRECCYRGRGQSVARDRIYSAWRSWCADSGHEPGSKATFGRNLAAVVPDLGNIKPRVDGVQIRCYTGIGLLGASPASPGISAVQGVGTEAGTPASPEDRHQQSIDVLTPESGTPASETCVKPQVNGFESGEAGNLALQTQHAKLTAREWFANHIAQLQAAGHNTAQSRAVFRAGEAAGFTRNNLNQAASAHPDVVTIDRKGGTATWSIEPGKEFPDYQGAAQWLNEWIDKQDSSSVRPEDAKAAAKLAGHPWHNVRRAAGLSDRINSVPARGESKTERIWLIVDRDDESA